MDPQHRDRIAFVRIVSGSYNQGMKARHVRIAKDERFSDALTFMAGDREHAEQAFAGDIIGLHNHGTIQLGDTFTAGEDMKFTGIPNFAPELFRRIRLKDPLKAKQLQKGLIQLSEEGAVQVFRPLKNNDLIVGAVGVLQFDVVVARLKSEYKVEAVYEPINVATARWVTCSDERKLDEFQRKNQDNVALDGADRLAYIAPTMVNLYVAQERYSESQFPETPEHGFPAGRKSSCSWSTPIAILSSRFLTGIGRRCWHSRPALGCERSWFRGSGARTGSVWRAWPL